MNSIKKREDEQLRRYETKPTSPNAEGNSMKNYYESMKQAEGGAAGSNGFNSQYTQKAQDALSAYENRGDFKYNAATDSSYQAARRQYTEGGKQAMNDTMGTATEMTGGYDNSYAQAAAQQQYNSYMSQLASLMPQYEQQAYNRWQAEGQEMKDYYGILKDAEATDYSRHRDNVADRQWQTQYDRSVYESDRAYDYQVGRDNVADSQWRESVDYQKTRDAEDDRRWQDTFDYQKTRDAEDDRRWQTEYDRGVYEYDTSLGEQKRQYDSNFAEEQRQYNSNLAEEQRQYDSNFAEEQRQYNNNAAISQQEAETDYYNALANYEDGKTDDFYTYSGTDDEGNNLYYKDGKQYSYAQGINPYTGNTNPDAKNGTFSNGYQPDNVGGKKLKKTGSQSDDTGVMQNIFTTGDGHYWLWNGKINQYEEVENPEPDRSDLTSKTKKQKGLTM